MPTLNENVVFAERYLLKELLGTHGISEVWLAEDKQENEELIAIKVYAPLFRLEEKTLRQLHDDYVQISALSHPHLLPFYSFDQYQGVPYVVIPYMANGSLAQQLTKSGPLTAYEFALLLKQAGSALQYLHTQQPAVLHQRIKPENILIAEDESYVLADFGLSSRSRIALRKVTGLDTSLPTAYAAPEFFAAHPVNNAASDIFALGITLYELCTGEVPWKGSGGLALLQGGEVPYLPGTYDRVLSNIVRACLDPNWEKRPTAADLEKEGMYFLENNRWKTYGKYGIVTANVIEYKPTPWYKYALVVLAVLLALAVAGYFYYKNYYTPGTKGKSAADQVITVKPSQPGSPLITRDTGSIASPDTPQTDIQKPTAKAATQAPAVVAPPKKEPVTIAKAPAKAKAPEVPPAPAKPAYTKPRTLNAFLTQMVNEEVPFEVRERWKPDLLKLFTADAAVYYAEDDVTSNRFSAAEFADILLSTDSTTIIAIDSTTKDEDGKVKELYVRVQSEK